MDIKQLTYFIEVANTESFSRAAAKLKVTQPALSISIKHLQEELGVELFYTFDRRQLLTDEGRQLLNGAQHLMDVYQKTIDDVRHIDDASSGHVVLGLPPLIGSCYFTNLIPEFNANYPNIEVSIVEEGARKIESMTSEGKIDIACTIEPVSTSGFETRLLTRQRNVALVNKDHPLAKRKTLKTEALKEYPFAIFNSDFILHHQIMATCRKAGFSPELVLLSSQWDFLVEIVSQNRGVSILPRPIMDKHPDPNVVCIPLVDDMKYWDIYLLWNKNRYLSKACQVFLTYTQQTFLTEGKKN